jgi:hypothetical protein
LSRKVDVVGFLNPPARSLPGQNMVGCVWLPADFHLPQPGVYAVRGNRTIHP